MKKLLVLLGLVVMVGFAFPKQDMRDDIPKTKQVIHIQYDRYNNYCMPY